MRFLPALSALVLLFTTSQTFAQTGPDPVTRARDELAAAAAATSSGDWAKALDHYKASHQASPSVVALEGLANAHYQLRHDEDARAAYRELLALQPAFPEGHPELRRDWERVRMNAEQRVREIDARRTAPAPAPPAARESRAREEREERREERPRDKDKDEDDEPVRTAKNAVFVELVGNGLLYSVNYERLFESPDLGVRVGASYMSFGASGGGASSQVTYASFPLVGSYYLGGENHKLQLGAGVTLVYVSSAASSGSLVGSASGIVPMPTGVLGYRYIPAKGGFAFSIGLTPVYVPGEGGGFLPLGGISFGAVL